jgi:DNA-directed RNA polymerase specialized sigma24 family protein
MSLRPDPDFLALIAEHEEALLRAARLLTGDWERAEHLLRDTLAWALAGWEVLAAEEVAALRIQQRLIADFLSGQADTEPPPAPVGADGQQALVEALAGLPAEDRAVVVSRYYLGLSAPEIGEILGAEAEQVSAVAARALAVLRRGQ